MRAEKIREIDTKELQIKLAESNEQLFRLKFQIGMGQTDGLKKYRELRRDRARMQTILNQRAKEGK
jgi:large subunit ribosomal protein L29